MSGYAPMPYYGPIARPEMGGLGHDVIMPTYATRGVMDEGYDHYMNRPYFPAAAQKTSGIATSARAPLLPPIQVPSRRPSQHQQQEVARTKRSQSAAQPKEEKIGGVTAHLDYVMDEMVDFVSTTTQAMYDIFVSKICLADIDMTRSILKSEKPVSPTFRKFVSQVLTSTRLPSSTVLLALHYLSVRMTILSLRRSYNINGGDVYSMLTTALLLGSKFLDDNTFQNRSWSDVSSISVTKLNAFETEWLKDINWDLHFDPTDPKGFDLWLRRWHRFQTKKVDYLTDSMQQACLESKSQRQVASPLEDITNSAGLYQQTHMAEPTNRSFLSNPPSAQWQDSRYDAWASIGSHSQYSPPSAPETGPTTPENGIPYQYGSMPLPMDFQSFKAPPPLQILSSNASVTGYMTPYTPQGHQHYTCNKFCNCHYYMPYGDRYAMAPYYGQTVAA